MGDMFDYFEKLSQKVAKVQVDIAATIQKVSKEAKEKEAKEKEKKDKRDKKDKSDKKKIVSSITVQPMTRLRKDISEVKNEQENPEMQFVIDRINDIFE